jgi:hypothetical protein
MKRIIIFLLFITSCAIFPKKEKPKTGVVGNTQINTSMVDNKSSATHCLRTFLTGEDAGGEWVIISKPIGSPNPTLTGDNPCIEFACGDYVLKYRVVNVCCKDSVTFTVKKCCITGNSTCL